MSHLPPSVSIRRGRPEDREFVLGLATDAFSRFGDYAFLAEDWVHPEIRSWVAEADGRSVGFVMVGLLAWPLFEAVLVAIAVDPSARGAGVGSALLETIHREVLEERGDIVLMSLDVAEDNAAARALFEKAGYRYDEDDDRQSYAGGQPALSMTLLIRRPDDGPEAGVTGRGRRPSRRR